MIQRKIKTKLIGKEEVFKILALGEATKLPVLLLGEPGVGKTQGLLDYAAAKYNYNIKEVKNKTFILELDEGTKTSEVKGRVNMKSLLENKEYKLDTPIADAEYILINEVDAIRRKNLGEHGATKESTVEAMKQLYNCYK